MQIFVNGEPKTVPEGVSAAHLLELLELTGQRIAVERNLEIVPRGEFSAVILEAGDQVEIVRAIGGG